MPLYIQYSKKKHSVHVCFDSHVDPLDANPVQGLFCCEENRREILFGESLNEYKKECFDP